ncbi:uncharacterized protein H6S33_011674 [Morchella sextelata]|uniref:uncharacterized protein n=1 Tax=Morchella sextelata TaxID=1174677 RepID=UPI001D0374F3|nr:uncharacterized protein H6S33_011674 [Morchella sextelata]KAH0611247.1 hypothetical protein H6S33_011674 [Morchella sextelata]
MSSVCAYPVSGNYGIAPQNLYLSLLLLGTVWHRKAWFAEAMLGGAMVYSSVAAVHALSTIHFDPPPVAELDAIPIYGVIYFALCVSPWVLIRSRNFRREFLGTRAVVFSWMVVIMVGGFAAALNVRFLPRALPDCDPEYTGRLRIGQQTTQASFPDSMARFIRLQRYAAAGPVVLVPITIYLSELRRHQKAYSTFLRKMCECCCGCLMVSKGWVLVLTVAIQFICALWGGYVLYVTQVAMWRVPRGERMDAVGQWGPFVGTAFVVMAAVVVRYGDEMSCRWREVE